ncbi:unnamed protein product [Orchesella dallaii]|uniref:Uncharacterized protein n=1 Tax=Orchesella dallaii TaxID=48710 RepID=A0ABP1S8B8_9HEXA
MPSKISYSLLHFHTLLVFFSTIHIIEGESANAIVDHKSLTSEIQPEQDVSNLGLQSKPTFLFENPITGLDSQVDQLSDDYEETNFLEIIAEEVAGLHHIDASNQGTGFSLQFSSISNDVNPKYNFKMHHTTKINGTVVYPDPELNWDFGSADERDTIYVIASNAVTNEAAEQYYTVIDWKGGTFQRINYSCSYHSLIIYEPELSSNGNVHGTWSEKAHVPNGIETFCPDVITTRETNSLLTLAKPSFIIVFKVLSAHKNGSETSFKFNYQQIRRFRITL